MLISITKAKAQLSELLRRSENGEDIILTWHGQAVAQLVSIKPAAGREARRKLLERRRKLLESMLGSGRCKASRGPSAARSQDFLYDKYGLPK